jgi:hypothetical protein
LHANFDSGNLRRFKTNKVGKAGCHLPEFRRHRAVIGVDNEFPQFEIRHPGAARQVRGQVGGQDGLKPNQPGRMGRQAGHARIGHQAVFQGADGAASPHGETPGKE